MVRTISSILLVLVALLSQPALGEKYKGGQAGAYQRPAMALRAQNKNVEWARTIESKGGNHLVAWKVKGTGEIKTTLLDSAGKEVSTQTVASQSGKVVGLSRSGKSAIIEVSATGKPTRFVIEEIGGNGTAKPYAPAKFIRDRAYFLSQERQAQGRAGSPQGDWTQAEQELKGQ